MTLPAAGEEEAGAEDGLGAAEVDGAAEVGAGAAEVGAGAEEEVAGAGGLAVVDGLEVQAERRSEDARIRIKTTKNAFFILFPP
jgi:hypothetical protein